MSRKIFVLLCVAVFLIASIGFISAEDSSDDVVESSDNTLAHAVTSKMYKVNCPQIIVKFKTICATLSKYHRKS